MDFLESLRRQSTDYTPPVAEQVFLLSPVLMIPEELQPTQQQSVEEYFQQLGRAFGATRLCLRRDPYSTQYHVGFSSDDVSSVREAMRSRLGSDNVSDIENSIVWLSGEYTQTLLEHFPKEKQREGQEWIEEVLWRDSNIVKEYANRQYDIVYILTKLGPNFNTSTTKDDDLIFSVSISKLKQFQDVIRRESNGCIVCPNIEDSPVPNVVIKTGSGGSTESVEVIFSGRYRKLLELGSDTVEY